MIKLIGLLLLLANLAHAEAPRADQLIEIFNQFNRRYTSGHYVADVGLANDFTAKQEAMVNGLKKSGGLKKILTIENDYLVDLNITAYAMLDEQNRFIAIYWDKSKYTSEEERSFLRFASIDLFSKGLPFVPISGTHAVVVKGFHFNSYEGGTLQFIYLKDFQHKTMGTINLFLLIKNKAWGIYSEQQVPVTSCMVKTWTGFLNGGVKEIILK